MNENTSKKHILGDEEELAKPSAKLYALVHSFKDESKVMYILDTSQIRDFTFNEETYKIPHFAEYEDFITGQTYVAPVQIHFVSSNYDEVKKFSEKKSRRLKYLNLNVSQAEAEIEKVQKQKGMKEAKKSVKDQIKNQERQESKRASEKKDKPKRKITNKSNSVVEDVTKILEKKVADYDAENIISNETDDEYQMKDDEIKTLKYELQNARNENKKMCSEYDKQIQKISEDCHKMKMMLDNLQKKNCDSLIISGSNNDNKDTKSLKDNTPEILNSKILKDNNDFSEYEMGETTVNTTSRGTCRRSLRFNDPFEAENNEDFLQESTIKRRKTEQNPNKSYSPEKKNVKEMEQIIDENVVIKHPVIQDIDMESNNYDNRIQRTISTKTLSKKVLGINDKCYGSSKSDVPGNESSEKDDTDPNEIPGTPCKKKNKEIKRGKDKDSNCTDDESEKKRKVHKKKNKKGHASKNGRKSDAEYDSDNFVDENVTKLPDFTKWDKTIYSNNEKGNNNGAKSHPKVIKMLHLRFGISIPFNSFLLLSKQKSPSQYLKKLAKAIYTEYHLLNRAFQVTKCGNLEGRSPRKNFTPVKKAVIRKVYFAFIKRNIISSKERKNARNNWRCILGDYINYLRKRYKSGSIRNPDCSSSESSDSSGLDDDSKRDYEESN